MNFNQNLTINFDSQYFSASSEPVVLGSRYQNFRKINKSLRDYYQNIFSQRQFEYCRCCMSLIVDLVSLYSISNIISPV